MSIDLDRKLGFSEEAIDASLRRGGLLSLELEFTRKCNLQCVYCYSSAGERIEGEMSFEEIMDVVAQAKALGARKIVLLGGGEPFLFSKYREVIQGIRTSGLSQVVFTNGTLLTPEICRFLFDNGLDVVIKHNSFVPSVQDALAGVPGAHRLIRRGLRFLREAGYPGDGRLLGIQSVVCRQNQQEMKRMWVWARERGIVPYFEVITRQGRAAENPWLELAPEEVLALFQGLAEIDAERFGLRWVPKPPIAGFTCRRHLYSCLVDSRGFVQPCTGIDMQIGNLKEKPLAEILGGSEVFSNLRRIYDRIDPACRSCALSGNCYGCRGNAYQITGDYLSGDPSCWQLQQDSKRPASESTKG
jgi:radical SAM protein with 4Fe4S-binding SPASM domain